MNDNEIYLSNLPVELKLVHLGGSHYTYIDAFIQVSSERFKNFSSRLIREITLVPFLSFFLFPLLNPKFLYRYGIKFFPFLFLIYLQIFFAVNTDRLVVAGFPAILILSISGLKNLIENLKLQESFAIILTGIYVSMNVFSMPKLYNRQIIVFFLILFVYVLYKKFYQKADSLNI
jgi:hypothetical protein